MMKVEENDVRSTTVIFQTSKPLKNIMLIWYLYNLALYYNMHLSFHQQTVASSQRTPAPVWPTCLATSMTRPLVSVSSSSMAGVRATGTASCLRRTVGRCVV